MHGSASSRRSARFAVWLSIAGVVAACGGTEVPKSDVVVAPAEPAPAPASASAVVAAPPAPQPGHIVRVAGGVACGSAVCHELDEICCSVEAVAEGSDAPAKTHFCLKATKPEDPDESMWLARQCAAKVDSPRSVAAFACDEASDCGDEPCGHISAVDIGESRCGWGSIELCKPESGCRTADTHCRQGIPCPFFGDICETHGICATKTLPTCGAQRCTESAPICCVSGANRRCSRDCREETDLGFPIGTVECSSARACGPDMACCMGITSSVCSTFCDVGVQGVACESDADCAPYEIYGMAKCGPTPQGDLKLRMCGGK